METPVLERRSKHCYAGKSALCWEHGLTREKEPTVFLQACPAVGERQYDWSRKITLQLSLEEMRRVLLVLIGAVPNFRASAHGQNNDKGFEIEAQGDKFFCKVFQAKSESKPGSMFAVPITPGDAFEVAALILAQMRRLLPGMSDQGILMLARLMAGSRAGG